MEVLHASVIIWLVTGISVSPSSSAQESNENTGYIDISVSKGNGVSTLVIFIVTFINDSVHRLIVMLKQQELTVLHVSEDHSVDVGCYTQYCTGYKEIHISELSTSAIKQVMYTYLHKYTFANGFSTLAIVTDICQNAAVDVLGNRCLYCVIFSSLDYHLTEMCALFSCSLFPTS